MDTTISMPRYVVMMMMLVGGIDNYAKDGGPREF